MKLKKVRWLGHSGRGVLLVTVAGQTKNVFPGEVAEVEPIRAEMLINKGFATANLLARVKIELDPEFPPPSKREREALDRRTAHYYGVTNDIVLQHRLHPHFQDVKLSPVPLDPEEE